MKKIITFNYCWQWNHWYLLPIISLHNYDNQFCIWIHIMGLWFEIIFIKKNK